MRYFFILLLIISIPAFAFSPARSPVFSPAQSPVIKDTSEVEVSTELPPANTVAPTVSGNVEIGSVLTCNNGSWDYSPTSYAYTWENASVTIGGETSQTYTTVLGDAGDAITCTVTATNAYGSSPPVDSSNNVTPESIPTNSVAPTVSGLAASGSTITCNTGTWTQNPDSYGYEFHSSGTFIEGATSSTFVTDLSMVGDVIGCNVSATNTAGTASFVSSSNTITVSDGSRPADFADMPQNPVFDIAFGSGGVAGLTVWNRTASPADDSAQGDYDMKLGDGSTPSTYPDATSGDYVEFDGVDSTAGNSIFFKSANTAFINNLAKTTPTPAWTVATVIEAENDVSSRMILETRSGAADASGVAIFIQGDDVCLTQGNGSAQMTGECNSHTATPWNFGGLNLIVVSYDGSTFESWVNNDKQSQAAAFGTNTANSGDYQISCSDFNSTNCLHAGEKVYYQAAWNSALSDADVGTLYTTTYPNRMGYNFDGTVYSPPSAGAELTCLEIDFNNASTNVKVSDLAIEINGTGNDYIDDMAVYTHSVTAATAEPTHGCAMLAADEYGSASWADGNVSLWNDNAWNTGTNPDNKTAHGSGTRENRVYVKFSSATTVNTIKIQIEDGLGSNFWADQIVFRDENGDTVEFSSAPGLDDYIHDNGLTGSSNRRAYAWSITGTDTGSGATHPQFLDGTWSVSTVYSTDYDGIQSDKVWLIDKPPSAGATADQCWASAGTGVDQYVQVDFGSNKTLTSVWLAPITSGSPGGWNTSYTINHDIKYSTDGSTWTDFAAEANCATVQGVDCEETGDSGAVTARYVRLMRDVSVSDLPAWVAACSFYAFGY